MFKEHVHGHPSRWAAIESIAEKIGCTAQTLDIWVRKSEPAAAVASSEAERVKALERENAELRSCAALPVLFINHPKGSFRQGV
jgi:transposase-like protein